MGPCSGGVLSAAYPSFQRGAGLFTAKNVLLNGNGNERLSGREKTGYSVDVLSLKNAEITGL